MLNFKTSEMKILNICFFFREFLCSFSQQENFFLIKTSKICKKSRFYFEMMGSSFYWEILAYFSLWSTRAWNQKNSENYNFYLPKPKKPQNRVLWWSSSLTVKLDFLFNWNQNPLKKYHVGIEINNRKIKKIFVTKKF